MSLKLISLAVAAIIVLALLLWPGKLYEATLQVLEPVLAPFVLPVRVLFVGDIMFDRVVATHADARGDSVLFAGVRELFADRDAVVGNLEGAITDNPSVSQLDHSILRFTFDPRMAKVLRDTGFTAVSLANNHSLDFGGFGYDDTLQYLAAQDIAAFGSPFNEQTLAVELLGHGKKLCLVGYHELFNPDPTSVLAKVTEARALCNLLVLVAHWGVEYEHGPSTRQQQLAHKFIDAGADVIIGAHPHVVEPLEIYKNRAIFYSLGNFIFDQDWRSEVKRGLAVGIDFGDKKTHFTLTPVNTNKEASVAEPSVAQAVLADIVTPDLPRDIKNSILTSGSFELAK